MGRVKPTIGVFDLNDPSFADQEARDIGPFILHKNQAHERTLFTDRCLGMPVGDRRFAWLQESPAILPDAYYAVLEMADDFELIFTHSLELVETLDNARYCPAGGCWIPPSKRAKQAPKTKDVSILVSEKLRTEGQVIRHRIAEAFPEYDAWGRGTRESDTKVPMLEPYRFSVIIENIRARGYFTEKLIDALVMRCVPIYWGDPEIFRHFEPEGIIAVSTCDEIARVLKDLPAYEFNETNREIALSFADGAMNLWKAGLDQT